MCSREEVGTLMPTYVFGAGLSQWPLAFYDSLGIILPCPHQLQALVHTELRGALSIAGSPGESGWGSLT